MSDQFKLIERLKQLPVAIRLLIPVLIVLLLGGSIWGVIALTHPSSPSSNKGGKVTAVPTIQQLKTTPGIQVTSPVSPYIFGTNLALFDTNDQVLNSVTTRTMLQQIHPTMIRMPVRDTLSDTVEIQAAQIIKSMGAVPLLVLHGPQDSNALAANLRIIRDMNLVFGSQTVYYEFGNEADLQGISVENYLSAWNAEVPQLKQAASHAQFVGPVNYHYDHNYLSTFLQNARPLPDDISWHEYTCDDAQPNALCIAHISNWTNHITDARALMTQQLGNALPIMITEWNYAPNAVPNDGKNNDSNFMQTWTTQALQTLSANRVFASMQYSCTNTAISLVNDANQFTMQGATFQNQYQRIILHNQQPPPVSGAAFPTVTPTSQSGATGPIAFSFEDGSNDGWNATGQGITNVQNSNQVALDGSHSLQVSLNNGDSGNFPYVSANVQGLQGQQPPQPGQTVSAYVYLPSNSVTITAKLFVMDMNYHWFARDAVVQLTPGQWTHLTFTIPNDFGQARQVGIQFNSPTNTNIGVSVYIDDVGWS